MTMTFPMWMLPLVVALVLFAGFGGHQSQELSVLATVASVCYTAEYLLRNSENPYLRFSPFYTAMLFASAVGAVYSIQWLFLGAFGIVALHLVAVWLARGDDDDAADRE